MTHHEEPARRDELPRRFGFWTGLFVVVASMVGSGILTTSGYLLRDTGSHLVVLALWAVGGLVALCGTLTLAELAAAFPRVGGEYVYVRAAFGPGWSFVYGAATIVLGFAAPIAALAHATAAYLLGAAGGGGAEGWHVATPVLATLLIVVISIGHALGQRQSAWLQAATTLFKAITLLGIALAGLAFGTGDLAHLGAGRPLAEQRPEVLAVGLVYVSYAYSGWNGAAYLAGETIDPQRRLPRALIAGCLSVTALYLVINFTYAFALDPRAVGALSDAEIERVAQTAAQRLFGPGVATLLALVIGLGLLASLSAFILTGPRVAFAMALDRLLPAAFATVHARAGTPAAATAAQALIALAVLWSGTFDAMLLYAGAGMALLAGLVVLAVFPLRRRGVLPGRFAIPWFPLPPVLYLLALAGTIGFAVHERPQPTLAAVASIALMWPLYRVLARRTARHPGR